ncbi:hypothetical protein MMC30_002589 [Trapelia coarctata]|nr:hypothetical protein [Trapelia coarctata]
MASPSTLDVSALLRQVETITKNPPSTLLADESARRKLRDAARNLSIAMEAPGDTIHRIGTLRLQSAMARIGIALKLFDILANSDAVPLSSNALAEKTNVDPVLMSTAFRQLLDLLYAYFYPSGRFLRCYASFGTIAEVGEDRFAASNVSRAVVPFGMQAGVNYL